MTSCTKAVFCGLTSRTSRSAFSSPFKFTQVCLAMATARPQMRCTAQSHAFTPPESGGRIKELSTAAPHCPLFFQEGNFSSCTSGEQKPPERFKPRYEQRGRTVLYSVLLDARFSASQAEHCVSGALHTTSIMDRGYATRTTFVWDLAAFLFRSERSKQNRFLLDGVSDAVVLQGRNTPTNLSCI
jgi:hypothetical protein